MEGEVTVLPPAGREEQIERWGLSPDRIGGRVRGAHAEDAEATGYDDGHDVEDEHAGEALGFLLDGGWHAVDPTKGYVRGEGTTSHRGVLHPDEHVDPDALRTAVESELGFSYDDVRAVFRQGRTTDAQLELRARIDARLLELSRAGGELMPLARAFGWAIQEAHTGGGATCRTLWRALERARKNEEASK